MNFYKHHLGDYDGATVHLSWDEDMAYTRLLRAYYRREGPLPIPETYRLARASTRAHKQAVDIVLEEFFKEEPDGWHNKRADEEIAAYLAQASTNRRIAQKRIVQRTVHEPRNEMQHESYNESYNEPSTNHIPNQIPDTRYQIPEPEKSKPRESASQGSRLAPAWLLPNEWRDWAMDSEGWTEAKTYSVAERFKDHWLGKAGKEGKHLDWQAVWRNWVRKEKEFNKGNGSQPSVQVICRRCKHPIEPGTSWTLSGDGRVHDACLGTP